MIPDGRTLLINITGRDCPGITAALTRILSDHDVVICDIEQTTSAGNLSLSFLVELPNPSESRAMFKDLLFAGWELGVAVDFLPPPADDAQLPKRRAFALTILGNPINAEALSQISQVLAKETINIDRITRLSDGPLLSGIEMALSTADDRPTQAVKHVLLPVSHECGVDLALQREGLVRRLKRLVVFDMDSTLIQGEIINELARVRGCEDKVSEITARAMGGELDFSESLRERVSLLEGTPVGVLDEVYRSIKLAEGARELILVLKRLGYRLAVISGGFTFFTNRLKTELGLDYAYANKLEVKDGYLTGRVSGVIVDGVRKGDLLNTLAQTEGIGTDQVIAIGDGANDLQMLELAGLGVAFNAKAAVRERADHAINRPRLDSILYLLGIREKDKAELLSTD